MSRHKFAFSIKVWNADGGAENLPVSMWFEKHKKDKNLIGDIIIPYLAKEDSYC